jgi:hypothetical protein
VGLRNPYRPGDWTLNVVMMVAAVVILTIAGLFIVLTERPGRRSVSSGCHSSETTWDPRRSSGPGRSSSGQ